jgi:hypothetical protein
MRGLTASLRSTNTTALGVLAVIAAAVDLAQTLMTGGTPDFNVLGLAIIGLIGILAKDGNKSSQDVGLRP